MSGGQNNREAWDSFWAGQQGARSGKPVPVPQQWADIDSVRTAVWQQFAKGLPDGAGVLDLATGDGHVLRLLQEQRTDLVLTGIDSAPALPPAPSAIAIHPGTSMEALPFKDASFAAITSQFGFEYGDPERVSAEAARVLQPGGQMALLTHREDGPIVGHNRKRREQLEWVLKEQDLLAIARRNAGGTVPESVSTAPAQGAERFGQGSPAWEIAEAIRRTLVAGEREGAAYVNTVLDNIERQSGNELGRATSLEAAAATAADHPRFLGAIDQAGFVLDDTLELAVGGDAPFADFRIFTRRA